MTPGYLDAMGMRLREGRDFTWQRHPHRPSTSSSSTRPLPAATGPVRTPSDAPPCVNGKDARVIGVISDVHESSLEEGSGLEMYLPITQDDPEGAELVRAQRSFRPNRWPRSVMRTLRAYNPGQPAAEFRAIQSIVDHAVSPRRFFVMLVAIFAGFGLLLASLGIYGVISYSVTRQTQEIGIRMALGRQHAPRATRGDRAHHAPGAGRHCGGNRGIRWRPPG